MVQAWAVLEGSLEDGLFTLDEENALTRYINHFTLRQSQLDAHGVHTSLIKAVVLREIAEGVVPDRRRLVRLQPGPDVNRDSGRFSSHNSEWFSGFQNPANMTKEAVMTARESPPCDCPEQPCVCFAEGYAACKNKAIANFIAKFDGPPHPEGCV